MPDNRNDIPQYQDGFDDDRFSEQEGADDVEVEQVDDSQPRTRKRRVAPPAGRSWGKILLILFGVGVLSMALCCGGVVWFGSKSIEMIEDPVKIAAAQQEIVDIQSLPGLRPRMAMKMNLAVVGMTMVGYEGGGQTSMLLMQMQVAGQTDEQLQQNFRQQGGKNQKNFQVESSETRKIKVDGTERDFLFAKGKILPEQGDSIPVRQVTGMFPSRQGMGFLIVTVDEESYDEPAVIQMIESIKK
jgi:hypothetical protein